MKRDIEKMSKFERLLLYLELPSSLSGMTDPLRQQVAQELTYSGYAPLLADQICLVRLILLRL